MALLTPLIALPAAGLSRRMLGQDKLLQTIEGEALLRRQAKAALETGCTVLVTLPLHDQGRRNSLQGLDVSIETVDDAAVGMSASLKVAARQCGKDQALMILLPDVPGIGTEDIKSVLKAFKENGGQTIVQATDNRDRAGTPVLFPARLLNDFNALSGDSGAKAILRAENVTFVRFPDDRATRDLDTPEDWKAWRRETGTPS